MIARYPDDLRESLLKQVEGQVEMFLAFPDVTAQDHPVIRVRRKCAKCVGVGRVAEVEVTDRP